MVSPACSASGLSCCTAVSTSSLSSRAMKLGARLLVGGPRTGRRRLARQVLAGQHALRDRRPDDLADAQLLAGRHDLGLDDPPQHRVLRLVGHQRDLQLPGQRVARRGSADAVHSETPM